MNKLFLGMVLLIGTVQLTVKAQDQGASDSLYKKSPFEGNKGTFEKPVLGEEYLLPQDLLNKEGVNTEDELIMKQSRHIQELQEKISKSKKQPLRRGFHAKNRGCLEGKFEVLSNIVIPDALKKIRPEITSEFVRYGIFKNTTEPYTVLARFSNGVGWEQTDAETEVRGFAVKVLGRSSDGKLSDEFPEYKTQDFVATNFPRPVGDNAIQFMDFADHAAGGKYTSLGVWYKTSKNPATVVLTDIISANNKLESLASETYYSGSPYRLGPQEATKFIFVPRLARSDVKVKRTDDFFITDIRDKAAAGPIVFDFYIQFQTDPEKTPVEHLLTVWTAELSPPVKVGTLTLFKQDVGVDEASPKRKYCDSLFFSPGNTLPPHRFMGNINRTREKAYMFSAAKSGRAQGTVEAPVPQVEPSLSDVQKVFGRFDANGVLLN